MPKRTDINKILMIGSGPIVIGQAAEFDYAGTQACKALRKLGYEIVLVNSNPATIMTDPATADATYIEPLNVKRLTEIIEKERPDALLANLGGQSALNLAFELDKEGILKKYDLELLGVQLDAIKRGEDRIIFKETMERINVEMARSAEAYSVEEAEEIAKKLGFPVVIRPAYTMGGAGGGLAYNIDEFRMIAKRGISASIVGQILVEESILGWEELEVEVIRDSKNQMIAVCLIENVDPVGVHTGDSFCVTPMQTIDADTQKRLKQHAFDIVEAVGVIGGTNVQFAHDPKSGRIVVIEINPRTSRSSALASKATGFPIALVSAMLAAGLTLDEIPYWRDGSLEKYTPPEGYVVIKFPRFNFEKFKGSVDKLGTQMRAVGEVLSIGKNYKEAVQKAVRSLEVGRYGLGFAKDFNEKPLSELLAMLTEATSERHFILYEALRKGATIEDIQKVTHMTYWFVEQMQELVVLEEEIRTYKGKSLPDDLLIQAKKDGFGDRYLSMLIDQPESEIRKQRIGLGVTEAWEPVTVSGIKEAAYYYYSTYNAPDKTVSSGNPKVMILGGGPNRIGQGIEFDYCCVHAAFTLRDLGYETIMVNCNPETVSTDYDTSNKLYFEPLTVEDVLSIYEKEKPIGVIAQFGGQTPLNIAGELEKAGVKILGTALETIDLAEDRDRFKAAMDKLGIPMPEAGMASSMDEAIKVAAKIGYPVMVRPSYVLGGRGMEIVHDEKMLAKYVAAAMDVNPGKPILIDRFLENAIEAEADAISDGTDVFVPAVMEHIEYAGIHSGDSACVVPPVSIPEKHVETIKKYTKLIAQELNVKGLMNIQYAIADDRVYVIEANPRASRTVPIVSKVCNISMARIATEVIMADQKGTKTDIANMSTGDVPYYGVKESVFPFNMFHEVDPVLGPEMRSTGEVLGLSDSSGIAFFKAQEATKHPLPVSGTVLITVRDEDKEAVLAVARKLADIGFAIKATEGTQKFLTDNGIQSTEIPKLGKGRPDIVDSITNKEINMVINTPVGEGSKEDDSYIRKAAIRGRVPYITTIAAAVATAKGIEAYLKAGAAETTVKKLQEFHAQLKK